jgi:hypothetical protein
VPTRRLTELSDAAAGAACRFLSFLTTLCQASVNTRAMSDSDGVEARLLVDEASILPSLVLGGAGAVGGMASLILTYPLYTSACSKQLMRARACTLPTPGPCSLDAMHRAPCFRAKPHHFELACHGDDAVATAYHCQHQHHEEVTCILAVSHHAHGGPHFLSTHCVCMSLVTMRAQSPCASRLVQARPALPVDLRVVPMPLSKSPRLLLRRHSKWHATL